MSRPNLKDGLACACAQGGNEYERKSRESFR